MRPDWYATMYPRRTIHLCDDCYVPDRLAGKRKATLWELQDAVWGSFEFTH